MLLVALIYEVLSYRFRGRAADRVAEEITPIGTAGTSLTMHRPDGEKMPICETCGNDYDKVFQLVMNGQSHTFDSFECAIHALAPTCKHCGTRVVGHGMEKDGSCYCCDHCAQAEGVTGLRDRL